MYNTMIMKLLIMLPTASVTPPTTVIYITYRAPFLN